MRIGVMARAIGERGGVGVYTANLIDELVALPSSHEWVIFHSDGSEMGRYSGLSSVTELHLRAPGKALWDQLAVPRACAKHGVNVVFHPKFTVPLLARCPSVMALHGTGWFTSPFFGRLDVAYIRLFLPLYLRRARLVSSVSRLTTEYYTRKHRLPEGKIRTIYFGPAPNFRAITDPGRLEAVRDRYGLPDHFVLNLTKHRDAERKNIRGVLDAFRLIAPHVPHSLVIGGTDCGKFRAEYGIPGDGWGARVMFPDWIAQEDLPAVYSLASVFFYPSFMEAFPIPITEAMACDTAIVTSDRNGLSELAGDAALLVNPDDPAAMAASLRRALEDAELRSELVVRGRKRSELFSWKRCARDTLALLEEAASAP